jgi:hypothetical protein
MDTINENDAYYTTEVAVTPDTPLVETIQVPDTTVTEKVLKVGIQGTRSSAFGPDEFGNFS